MALRARPIINSVCRSSIWPIRAGSTTIHTWPGASTDTDSIWQCTRDRGVGVYPAPPDPVMVDPSSFRALGPLPCCPACGARRLLPARRRPFWSRSREGRPGDPPRGSRWLSRRRNRRRFGLAGLGGASSLLAMEGRGWRRVRWFIEGRRVFVLWPGVGHRRRFPPRPRTSRWRGLGSLLWRVLPQAGPSTNAVHRAWWRARFTNRCARFSSGAARRSRLPGLHRLGRGRPARPRTDLAIPTCGEKSDWGGEPG
jgi:hypothetical protein